MMTRINIGTGKHEDKTGFREALMFTERQTSFGAKLVEKDYYCSLVLYDLMVQKQDALIFKGGTCLCKVHGDFYRMSEDLDFLIATDTHVTRSGRRELIEPVKPYFSELPERLPCFQIIKELKGHNSSRQYTGSLSYQSVITGEDEYIKIEINLREPVLKPVENKVAQTLLINPATGSPMFDVISVNVLSYYESYAEKFRAMLTRREPAIRDIYDIDIACRTGSLDINNSVLMKLIRKKLAIPGVNVIDLSENRIRILNKQIVTELKPVLRNEDYASFDFDRAIKIIIGMTKRLNPARSSYHAVKNPS